MKEIVNALSAKPGDRLLEIYNPMANRTEKVNKIKHISDGPAKPRIFSPKNMPRKKDMMPSMENRRYILLFSFLIEFFIFNLFSVM
ncbi:MAG: hypothetical protein QMC77_05435 [Methanocellales archaeon]|nr:hypothetical protein [Methanocellales archaeon]